MRFAWVGIVAVVAVVGALSAASRDDSGAIVGAGALQIVDVRVGDCFDLNDGFDIEEVGEIRAIPCDEPHAFEAYFLTELAAGSYPSRSVFNTAVEAACLPSFETYVGRDYETSELYVTSFEPTPEGWHDGDRSILCVLSTYEAATPLTGSVRDSGR
ncbi:MAG TPA: septum formation family protein [Candidatus Binatia bacterium]|nr:septum formation family protein [Candidatus Binatia bacterium]